MSQHEQNFAFEQSMTFAMAERKSINNVMKLAKDERFFLFGIKGKIWFSLKSKATTTNEATWPFHPNERRRGNVARLYFYVI